ncbi:hypothetical protein [Longimicrobium terrae]|uniref:Uncharacterized protein n=1 Tax=Longimicrobium terrae TaxID=1639882 RepID=A0A841H391_9BACT|nr:hypothetical protein [Longimicrobium terrae]MBB4638066.1 hypothetical protein [Longimicrobium terrae]MBB6072438.1 hypothetical protein [Longimicrobium terrae]NNC32148.1 hypothetical protein [Longimicrobium terrae]
MPEPTFYSRYYKCDLQMQTPMEPHWRDPATHLSWDSPEDRCREVAGQYLRRCHEVGLEVIGITDHNFAPSPDQSFIRWLRAENARVAGEVGRAPLTIFPGFEIQADVGRGCHVLCLFPEHTPLTVLQDRVTTLGLPSERRFVGNQPLPSTCNLKEILRKVQDTVDWPGLVIAAHPLDVKGLFQNERIADWLQAEEFRNPNLVCIEVPKPLDQMTLGWQRLIRGGEDCHQEWKRPRPIAYIMSSDCYRLNPVDGDESNYIGFRYTWIKMSDPSRESLRQAFLDRDSRIRLQKESPQDAYCCPRIASVEVRGASFLRRPETLYWSPNLNCLIGARGVGKSTFIDYLRIALDRMREEDAPASFLAELRKRIDETLPPEATVEVVLATRGGDFRVIYHHGRPGHREIYPPGAEEPAVGLDVRTLFPCRFLSQREIDHTISTGQATALRSLLDDLVREELARLSAEAAQQIGEIQQIDAHSRALRATLDARPGLETNLRLAQGELEQNTRIAGLWPQWEAIQTANRFIEELHRQAGSAPSRVLEQVVEGQRRLDTLRVGIPAGQHHDVLQRTAEIVVRLHATYTREIQEASARLRAALGKGGEVEEYLNSTWKPVVEADLRVLQDAGFGEGHEGFADVPELAHRVATIEKSLEELVQNEGQVAELEKQRVALLGELRQTWVSETRVRSHKADRLMSLLRARPDRKPMVEIRLSHQGDDAALVDLLGAYIHDKRRLNEEDIRTLLGGLSPDPADESPLLVRFVTEVRNPNSPLIEQMAERRRIALRELFNDEVLRGLELERIPDAITLLVYRRDGTLAGPIDRVSAGQQGTAILNLVLADGDDPLIIDTPEEGLDSEGVYQELVPLFRQAKERRQIVVVTHNANIPVNADAEGIIALEASGFVPQEELESAFNISGLHLDAPEEYLHVGEQMGWPDWEAQLRHYLRHVLRKDERVVEAAIARLGERRQAEGRIKRFGATEGGAPTLACGALDTHEVSIAVQQVMEGSREAFEQRREKYGY